MSVDALAETLIPRLRATVAPSEAARRVTDDAVALLKAAGLIRLLAPARYGGQEDSPRAQILANAMVAHGSAAASWVQMVCTAHTFILGRFPLACQDEVFGGDPDVLIPGTPASQGTCERADGGLLVNGRWQFCSGVDHGRWILAGARGKTDAAGKKTPSMLVIMPITDLTVEDTWHVLGMRGTGSKDIVADNIFVPVYRSVSVAAAFLGIVPGIESPLYRLPVAATLSAMGLGTIVGMAEAGLAEFLDQTRIRQEIYLPGAKANRAGLQMRVAEADTEIALARTLLLRNCDLLEAAMRDTAPMDTVARAQVRWHSAYGAELCRRAADRLYAAAGAHATFDANPLQTFFRNINTVSHHAVVDFDSVAEMHGKALLGVEQSEPGLV